MQDERKSIVSEKTAVVNEEPLFRPQVLAEQQSQWLGKVLLAPSISHAMFAIFAVLSATLIVSFLFLGDYTRKERISGWLVPQKGLVQVYTPQPGVITQINVREGSEVQSGDTLMIVSTELQSEALGATQQEIVRRLEHRRNSLTSEKTLESQLFDQQHRNLTRRIDAGEQEKNIREQELDVQQQRLNSAEELVNRLSKHRSNGTVSGERWLESENDRLDQLMRLRELQRDYSITQRESLVLRAELDSLPLEHKKRLAQIARDIDMLEQELAEAEARRQIVLTAPQSGTIATLQLKPGSSVKSTLPLLSIIPAGSELEARLYLPTRAIGFLKTGQQVLLRYRAFPYQKFGHYKGTIAEISRSTVNPSELSPQTRGAVGSQATNEPLYPVTVSLLSQTVNAYGQAVALQPGMELEADVLIEKRRLIEWVLEPLYSLTGKLHG